MVNATLHDNAQAYTIQPEGGQILENLRTRLLATGAQTNDTLCAMICDNPGPGGPPLHTHHAHVEFFLVLQGHYRFRIGETDYEGGPGTFAYIPQDVIHAWASVGPGEGRLFAAVLPGEFAGFLEQLEMLSARGADHDEYASLYRDYQSEINGPPLVQQE
jgi:mannose-6-phosphate isomerase-like protein (cupin superfamily)